LLAVLTVFLVLVIFVSAVFIATGVIFTVCIRNQGEYCKSEIFFNVIGGFYLVVKYKKHYINTVDHNCSHQIRIHMAGIGHPLLGDLLYGGGRTKFERENSIRGQCLFAKELRLTHPRTGELMTFTAELPENFARLLEKLRKIT
jgi:hypothetical protein